MSRNKWLLIGVLGTFTLFPLVQAAEENSGGTGGNSGAAAPSGGGGGRERGNRRGGRGGGGNFDPGQYRDRMTNYYKEMLGATDEEWKTLQPKVEKVSSLQRDLRGSFGAFGGRGGGGGNANESATAKAQSELRSALQDKNASSDDIAKKLAALREARAKTKEDLAAAQKDLKASVNARQEAGLVAAGLID